MTELEALAPVANEEQELTTRRALLRHGEAIGKALIAANLLPPPPRERRGTVLLSIADRDKATLERLARPLVAAGYRLVATPGTRSALAEIGFDAAIAQPIGGGGDNEPQIVDIIRSGETVLVVDKIRKQFGGLVAVNDISFEIAAGQIVGLIGPNGAGKSTTFNLITGVLSKTSGHVRFRGDDVSDLPSRDISRAGMARTFQHVKMIPDMTVLENVAMGAYSRGNKGVVSGLLRTNQAEEQRLFKEARCKFN